MKGDHVIIDLNRSCLRCLHCGEVLGLSLPMEVTALNRLGAAFLLNHRDCEPADPQSEALRRRPDQEAS